MDAIIVLLGLFIGGAIFLVLMNNITAIVYSCQSVAITFFICWGIGIVLAWIAWKIAIIIGIIALIAFIIGKITKPKSKPADGDQAADAQEPSADAQESAPQTQAADNQDN